MATAESTYVDPSALARLYLFEQGSREMAAWRWRTKGPLPVTLHGRAEVVNAIALKAFRGDLTLDIARRKWDRLQQDFAEGELVHAEILWRAALGIATDLSRKHTPSLGTRSLDVMHVACALELKLPNFLSFDQRQTELARAVGLRPILLQCR